MKKVLIIALIAIPFFTNQINAQDVYQYAVPSIIVNNFQKAFPKARDVEWEIKGNLYKVEFETGFLGRDHDVWLNESGAIVKHKEELNNNELPAKVVASIRQQFKGYHVDDVHKITMGKNITYSIELESNHQELKIEMDPEGHIFKRFHD